LEIRHAKAAEGKKPHLLLGPNFDEASARNVAVSR
jgi:hypothetical protein